MVNLNKNTQLHGAMSLPKPFYETELGRLYHGDCLDILPHLEPVDLVLTDPPYEHQAHIGSRRTRAVIEGRKSNDLIQFDKITPEQRGALTKINCNWILVFCQAEAVYIYAETFGQFYKRPMVWIKPDCAPQFTGDRPAMGYESIVCAYLKNEKSRWNGGGKRGVYINNSSRHDTDHQTEKPVNLLIELIKDFHLGGVVLDPFFGSGSTAIACERLKLKWIGIEREFKYVEISVKRIEQERKQLKLF